MATANQAQKRAPENLKMQLALAVKSIQWSYSIFWSISDKQPGALEWCDGYYNGDIKTRKTAQGVELNADELGLQRTDQLRELYQSLLGESSSPQPKRPTAALSPKISPMQSGISWLPGRTLAKNGTVWLCNAHRADTKVFSRSLLAKSASLQTIVCFRHSGGVIEIGTTELVPEDLNLIQHIKTLFLENPSDILSHIPNHGSNIITQSKEGGYEGRDMEACSPNNSSDEFADNLLRDESNLVEAISNVPNNSMSSSDCVSQTRGNPETNAPLLDGKKLIDNCMNGSQECNQQNHASSKGDDIHYQSVLTSLLKSSHQLIMGPHRNGNGESSFVSWTDKKLFSQLPQTASPQKLLKKVLFEVARMHEKSQLESAKENREKDELSRQEGVEVDKNHVLSERKRREKINERFTILGSLVPSGAKVDKVSILDHTIEYLRELERKIEELGSYKEVMQLESNTQSKAHDAMERTSDNYGPKNNGSFKKLLTNKRPACETEQMTADNKRARLSPSTDSTTVIIKNRDVLIEIRCSWRETMFLEVMEAIVKLHLDSQTVQSSNANGILSMSIKAKCKGVKGTSAAVIKQALQKVIRKP